ncbi:MAG: hypothetical protein FJ145_17695 [Deltaproteobacteria bacterium]|nr:hypothetical protein [Deltaproteobacteria bacterium]
MKIFFLLLCFAFCGYARAVELPALNTSVNDLAGLFPPASIEDLNTRLHRFKTETAKQVVVLTVKKLDGHDVNDLARTAFAKLPLSDDERQATLLFVVARQEHLVSLHAGTALHSLLPQPRTSEKLRAQYVMYADGLRPDLGIHGAVHYLFRLLRGDAVSDEEKLEAASLRGAGAGPIFAVFLGPFLAFFIGGLWGVYATQYGVERRLRLLMGSVFGGATAKLVITLMAMLGPISNGAWYFIMAIAIPLGTFGSLTEFWMSGSDWRGIPRDKERRGKPEDNMGI